MANHALAESEKGDLEFTIQDSATHKAVACRIHLKDGSGKAQRADPLPFFRDHFVCSGNAQLRLPVGSYTFEIERGPEYLPRSGSADVRADATNKVAVQLERLVDMAAEGWWSGELHVHRLLQDIPLLMQAEDLHVAPVITWWNNQNQWANQKPPDPLLVKFDSNRYFHVMGGEDEREGGALLFFNPPHPLPITGADREFPSPMTFVDQARKQQGVWIDIEKPFWWDVPVWLASGQVDSIGLANNHMCRSQMYENEAWGKPRDAQRLPSPRGNGLWTQEIYYQILNCGLRIPPSAGSASGVLPNPVGYNRVYVFLGKDFNYENWWQGLRAGRSFVSNGPLLRCRANGELPGQIFTAPPGKELRLDLDLSLSSSDPISSIEVVKNGRVELKVPFEDWKRTGKLGTLGFTQSGWFLVRAIADNPITFRFASTAPYYVEIADTKRRISRASAQFFLDWVRERAQRVKLEDPAKQAEVLGYHQKAERYWQDVVVKANAE